MNPKHGEIWLVEFEPQVGTEIKKTRPAVVVSINLLEKKTTRNVVPLRNYHPHHDAISFYLVLEPNTINRLYKKSTVDCIQIKSFDKDRFQKKIGNIETQEIEEISQIIAFVTGYIKVVKT